MSSEHAIGAPERILAALLEARTGHALGPERMWRVETMLQPILRKHALPSLEALVILLASEADRALVDEVIDALINNETYFFRDIRQFEELNGEGLERVRAANVMNRKIAIWSAGCSTGQEPYSLAMMFAEEPERWAGWQIDIIATDVSATAIAAARKGRYSHFDIQRGLPVRMMLRWCERDGNDWLVRSEIRERVRFIEHNLVNDPLPPGPFDIILCRNLLIYLRSDHRQRAVARLADALTPHGLCMLGAFETMIEQGSPFTMAPIKGFYERATRQPAPPVGLSARR